MDSKTTPVTVLSSLIPKVLQSAWEDTIFYVLSAHGQATYVLAERGGGRIIRSLVNAMYPPTQEVQLQLCDYVLSILLTVNYH